MAPHTRFLTVPVPPVDIAIPTFGYQNHVSIDREHGLIRRWDATDAAAYEGARLREGLLDKTNTASAVWAYTAYRSQANEAFLESNGFVSRIHRKEPPRRPMPETTRRANAVKSKVRSGVEHVFAVQNKSTSDPPCRHRPRQAEDRHGQSRLQLPHPGLPRSHRHRLTPAPRPPNHCPIRLPTRCSQKTGPRDLKTCHSNVSGTATAPTKSRVIR